ncbi:PAS domain S-box protein [Natrarchaeobius halalkaliphilus]|uniref:histidine kinase n=1 Tax=Natrarchaeobius halalkaliphilus TaxID=1679091 RepID=A0A3N6M083_9EURY|nr:PAS domain-containing sensor histidine kinase [Natrarchaeobius halalkaliphilus]RQG89010.1 PAS domain S-box protein [Natrarchaeobius halalkaliphilus]
MTETECVELPSVLKELDTGITIHDPESGAVLNVNSRLEQLYGYSTAELREMTVEDYTAPSTTFTQEKAVHRIRAAANGSPQTFDWKIERANGEYRWVTVQLTRTEIEDVPYVLAEINDVTEYRAREHLLRLLNRVIRHNLRNDMNVLLGYADRVKGAIENEQVEKEIDTILDIATEVGSLSDSLDQIENVVQPDATHREPTNLRNLAQMHAVQAKSEYPSADITVNLNSGVWVSADRSLEHAIENAIENAVEHNDRDPPKVEITTETDPRNGLGIISIADNGPSIPDVEIDVLRDESIVDSTYHGSGVGLWVIKWCVDSLGGELAFEENTPRGNTVRIGLPKIRHESADS